MTRRNSAPRPIAPLVALSCALLLIGCDNAGDGAGDNAGDIGGSASEPGPVSLDDPEANLAATITTGEPDDGKETAWFCSVFEGETFLSRIQLELFGDGGGRLGQSAISWSTTGPDSIDVVTPKGTLNLSNILFENLTRTLDHFDARAADGAEFSCDWSGPSRYPADVLLDEAFNDAFGEDERYEDPNLEFLLVNGRDRAAATSYWRCELIDGNGAIDYLDYMFYSKNVGSATLDFEWYVPEENIIVIEYAADDVFQLEEVVFADEQRYAFKAYDTRGYETSCEWQGPPRATTF